MGVKFPGKKPSVTLEWPLLGFLQQMVTVLDDFNLT